MKLHSPTVVGQATLSGDPASDLHATPKQYVDRRTAGGIFVIDIEPTSGGLVGLKEYHAGTLPADYYLSGAVTNTADVRVHFLAEPNVGATTVDVTVNGIAADQANISADPANPRVFYGYVDITVDEEALEEDIVVVSSTGTEYTVPLTILIGGPEITDLNLGAYPGSQTEVKAGDTVSVSGVIGNDAETVTLVNFGVSGQEKNLTLGAADSAGVGYKSFTGSFTVSSRSGELSIRAYGTNLLGTDGDPFTSADTMTVSQVYPSFGAVTENYPAGQQAIKGNESMTFDMTVSNADSVVYTPNAGLSVTDPNSYASNKTVTRIDETIGYQVDTNNISVTATRSANGAVSTTNLQIDVANDVVDAQIIIVGSPSSLRSSAAGEDYTIEVRADQKLLNAPTSLVASGGTLSGSWTKVSDSRYRTTLTIDDSVSKGNHTFSGLTITNLANTDGSTITSGANYLVAGIVQRDLTVPALSQSVAIGTNVYDVNNVIVSYKGADVLTYQADKSDVQKGFTIVDSNGDLDPTGDHVWISDSAFAGSNTSGTLILEFEETE